MTVTRLLQQLEEGGTVLHYKRRIILRLPNKLIKDYGLAVCYGKVLLAVAGRLAHAE